MDIALYYQEKGNKEPFILLHGNGENGSYFKHQIDYFSDRYRVIALDTRGHGKSPRGMEPFTIEQFSCDLYHFMASLEISSAVILGFSDGANIAMKFAIKYPDKVIVFILGGALAEIPFSLIYHYGEINYGGGSSGGIFALIAAFVVCYLRFPNAFKWKRFRPDLLVVIFFFVFANDNVSGFLTHAFGFIAGILLTTMMAVFHAIKEK